MHSTHVWKALHVELVLLSHLSMLSVEGKLQNIIKTLPGIKRHNPCSLKDCRFYICSSGELGC